MGRKLLFVLALSWLAGGVEASSTAFNGFTGFNPYSIYRFSGGQNTENRAGLLLGGHVFHSVGEKWGFFSGAHLVSRGVPLVNGSVASTWFLDVPVGLHYQFSQDPYPYRGFLGVYGSIPFGDYSVSDSAIKFSAKKALGFLMGFDIHYRFSSGNAFGMGLIGKAGFGPSMDAGSLVELGFIISYWF